MLKYNVFKNFILTILILSLSYGNANSFSHDKLKKGLKKIEKGINKELNKSSKSKNSESASSKEVKSSDCGKNKKIIYYKNTDKYLRAIGPEKLKSKKAIFSNFSFVSQTPGKNYVVEYVFDPNGKVTTTNLESCKVVNYTWSFKGRGGEDGDIKVYLGNEKGNDLEMVIGLSNSRYYKNKIRFHRKGQITNCYNYQNPQCNQFIAETSLVGFRDLKNNKSYSDLKNDYLTKVASIKKKKEQERLEKQKQMEAKAKAREESERAYREKQEREQREREERAKKQREYNNSPEGILLSSYQNYMLIKGFYETRKQYKIKYVNSQQFSTAKSQIKAIENTITKKNKVDSDKVWSKASEWYKKNWASTMELYKSTGTYTQQAAGTVKLYLMSLNSTYNKIVKGGASAPKKDF